MSEKKKSEIYNEIGLYDIILSISDAYKFSNQLPERRLIRNLLPINNAYGFYFSNTFKWTDTRTDKVFEEKFEFYDEEGRINAINSINERIKEYNQFVNEHIEKLGLEIEKQEFYSDAEFWMWGLNVTLVHPLKEQKDVWGGKIDDDIKMRSINNEFIYKRGLLLAQEEFVPQFNKMIYDFLINILNGKQPTDEKTLYNPILEFEDWFETSGYIVAEMQSLLDEVEATDEENVVSKKIEPNQELVNAQNIILKQRDKIKLLKNPATEKVKDLINKNRLDEFVDRLKFKSSGKINWSELSKKLGCSDKKAKLIIKEHAPYLLKDIDTNYLN